MAISYSNTYRRPNFSNNYKLSDDDLMYNLMISKRINDNVNRLSGQRINIDPATIGQPEIDPTKYAGAGGTGLTGFFRPLSDWYKNISTSNSGYSLTGRPGSFGVGNTGGKAGLTIGGKNLSPIANLGTAAYQGYNAFKNLNNLDKVSDDRNDLISKIKVSAAGNPMLSSYLTGDEISTLNKLRRGGFNDDSAEYDGFSSALGGAGKGALTGIAGGVPGMLIGALGGGINGILSAKAKAQERENATLEALYQSLSDAQAQYKSMRIPNYTGLGLQSRYTNQWI